MSSFVPIQIRTVDPYASYNSDIVNKFTRMLTSGNDALEKIQSCDVTDSTSTDKVTLSPGVIYKDDLWIEITEQHIVDFTDSLQYHDYGNGFDEVGYYYIILNYTFQKQRPAPEAEVLIIKPSQRYLYTYNAGAWLFLKAVHVSGPGPHVVDGVSDYDPDNPTNKREFLNKYVGTEHTLPSFILDRDLTRILYIKDEDAFYVGSAEGWQLLSASTMSIDTSGFSIGDLVYINSSGNLAAASSNALITTADGVVLSTGKILTAGKIHNVLVESGSPVSVGDLLYLSSTQVKSITNVKPSPLSQFVGRCLAVNSPTSANILFVRGDPSTEHLGDALKYVNVTLSSGSWILSSGFYYQDVNMSTISNRTAVVTIWDLANNKKIEPKEFEYINVNTLRVWMPINTKNLKLVAVGPVV